MISSSESPAPLQTAVLFLVFNRPDATAQVFGAIQQAKPPRLYVAADGPREGREGEAERVAKARKIATAVDWPCEVKTLFREKNLGCKYAVSGAITWFFEHEEQGIILEDDCVPHSDFFTFCETLLNRYAEDDRVSVVTGNNFQKGRWRGEGSYYFSQYNHCWGWATWRHAWKSYQGDLPFWPKWRRSDDWMHLKPDWVERRYWERIFDRVHAGEIDSWAYPWTASVWYHGGLTATPNVNLVSNIGFGEGATHTKHAKSKFADMPVGRLGELEHPSEVMRDIDADRLSFDHHFGGENLRSPRKWIIFPRRVARYLYRRVFK
ncbi:glycosyltransferase family 2 protein, partial [Spiribacter roseus]|uniref:glycosyltransferase family 2 protein n=1 Tax=Spiribacter roseus TaxID=1855875 RepID=UPI0013308BC8